MQRSEGGLSAPQGPPKHAPTRRRGGTGDERAILSVGHFAAREACHVVRVRPGFDHKMRSSSRTELLSGLIDIYFSRSDQL